MCAGLGIDGDTVSSGDTVCGEDLVAKIQLISNSARQQLLVEMTDPTVRVWLIFLQLYGKDVDRILSYTMNDGLGNACKLPRIVRTRRNGACCDANPIKFDVLLQLLM